MKVFAAAAALLLTTSCGVTRPPAKPAEPASATTSPRSASPRPCGPLQGGSDSAHMFLKDVRAAAHDGFDRVVFEFEVPEGGDGAIPRYVLREAEPPFTKEPSDEPMAVSGSTFLALNLQGASGVDLSGDTFREVYTGPKELRPNLAVLVELEEQGDSEATINWVFGLKRVSCPTVTTLSGPHRIVIDLPSGE